MDKDIYVRSFKSPCQASPVFVLFFGCLFLFLYFDERLFVVSLLYHNQILSLLDKSIGDNHDNNDEDAFKNLQFQIFELLKGLLPIGLTTADTPRQPS